VQTEIKGFFGYFRFLSNFAESPIEIDGHVYPTVEHYYQSQKSSEENVRRWIREAETPAIAKKRGNQVVLRPDWKTIRIGVMCKGVEAKFRQNTDLQAKLLVTDPAYLEETNYWNDDFWGVCNGNGKNHLGLILMNVRTKLKMERFYE
jgi:ribA/ribD-fused uncharacterized protein